MAVAREKIAQMLVLVKKACPHFAPEDVTDKLLIDVWYASFRQVDETLFKEAIKTVIKTAKRFPSVAEVFDAVSICSIDVADRKLAAPPAPSQLLMSAIPMGETPIEKSFISKDDWAAFKACLEGRQPWPEWVEKDLDPEDKTSPFSFRCEPPVPMCFEKDLSAGHARMCAVQLREAGFKFVTFDVYAYKMVIEETKETKVAYNAIIHGIGSWSLFYSWVTKHGTVNRARPRAGSDVGTALYEDRETFTL